MELERFDESLKTASRSWWTRHSQDYFEDTQETHNGPPGNADDANFLKYLDKIDAEFKHQAYFAQKKHEPLFFELMPKDLSGKSVLEVGCGLGAHSEQLARRGAKLSAVDLSPQSIKVTQRRFKLKKLEGCIQEGDAENLPFEDNSFDYVWSWGVIHHTPNTIKAAQEIVRVLKPGGKIGIMLYHKNSLYNWVNVIFRYGVLQGKLLKCSVPELWNRYTDGKHLGGAPIVKYYSSKEISRILFPQFKVDNQISYDIKNSILFIFPKKIRRKVEKFLPDA